MKKITYTKEVQEPKLVIEYDSDCESPRQNSNIGYFFTKEGRYNSPDGVVGAIYEAMIDAESEAQDAESHMKAIKRIVSENTDEKVMAIYPIYRYEHNGIVYHRGIAKGLDYSNCGFYIITDKTLKAYGEHAKPIEALIDGELEEYNKWINGEVYRFTLLDNKGEQIEGCGGFYDIEDIREFLPAEEWKNEKLEDYLV